VSEIEVAIGPAPSGYRVEVVRSPAGEASAPVSLDADGLLSQRKALENAVLLSSVQTRQLLSTEERRVRDVGQALFRALLGTGPVAGRYRAAERDDDLRIVLRISDPELAGLPWEAMYDEEAGGYVCRRHQLVRHVGVPAAAGPLTVTPPLRVLGIVSSPRGLPPLDTGKEQEQLTRALARLTADGLVELAWAPSATWADLHDTLLGGSWHVVHFIGHGDFDPSHDAGLLALTSDTGRAHLIDGNRFVDLLRQARPMPRLVVLNSCSGAASSVTDLFSGTAAALVRGGVTAVAAMQYEITDSAAIAFARGFYGAIARGRGVDEAVSSARVAILGLSGRTLEWVTPVLYLRGQDSHLFALSAASPPAPSEQPGGQPGGQTRPRVPEHLVRTLTGHTSWVLHAAFSQDGSLLATAGSDATIRLWDPGTWAPAGVLTGHPGQVRTLAFSPHRTMLASAGDYGTVRLWDPAARTPVATLPYEASSVWAVAFSPDGSLLAAAGDDRSIRLWDVATWTEAAVLTGHAGTVLTIAFSPDGAVLASAGQEDTVRLWNPRAGTQLAALPGHTRPVWRVAFSPGGALLAVAEHARAVRLWDPAARTPAGILTGPPDLPYALAFSPDGALLAAAGQSRTVQLWNVATRAPAGTLAGHAGAVRSVVFSPDGTMLVSASEDGTVRLWEAR
jgi:WD40 repeat protein